MHGHVVGKFGRESVANSNESLPVRHVGRHLERRRERLQGGSLHWRESAELAALRAEAEHHASPIGKVSGCQRTRRLIRVELTRTAAPHHDVECRTVALLLTTEGKRRARRAEGVKDGALTYCIAHRARRRRARKRKVERPQQASEQKQALPALRYTVA